MWLPSRPVWGAWIEITSSLNGFWILGSRPVWGAWIEISQRAQTYIVDNESRPVWGAWIEIYLA